MAASSSADLASAGPARAGRAPRRAGRGRPTSPGGRSRCGRRSCPARPGSRVPDRRLLAGERSELVALDDLPLPEADEQAAPTTRGRRAGRGGGSESVRPSIDQRSSRGDDDRRHELAEAGVERLLADGRLPAEAVEVGARARRCSCLEPIPLDAEPVELVAGRRDAHRLGERDERRAGTPRRCRRGGCRRGSSADRRGRSPRP